MTKTSGTNEASIKEREHAHFGGEGVYVISFLEHDNTSYGRFLIKTITGFWDRHLAYVKPEWIDGKNILEACCGNPRALRYFESRGAKMAAGCDLNDVMIRRGLATEWAYAYGRRFPNGKAAVFVADCEKLPILDSRFDTLFIIQALHHLDADKFIAEARRVLKQDGILFISDPNGGHPLRRFADSLGRRSRIMSADEKAMSARGLCRKLKNGGFDIVEARAVNLLAELFFLFTVMIETRLPAVARVLRIGLVPLALADRFLENTLFRIMPVLSWRNIIIARNSNN